VPRLRPLAGQAGVAVPVRVQEVAFTEHADQSAVDSGVVEQVVCVLKCALVATQRGRAQDRTGTTAGTKLLPGFLLQSLV
jgi:sulfur relay (sulfurtransferase) complex TusBCD TusD component (DsrE family)